MRDTATTRRFPVVNWILILTNLAVFVHELRLPPASLKGFLYQYGVVPYLWFQPDVRAAVELDGNNWVPLVTSQFLHGGWLHVISNLWVLYIFGDNVEEHLGSLRYLFFYLLSGVAASALHIWTNPESQVPAIGASGAIAGVMGAYLVLFPRARVVTLIPIFIFPWIIEVPAYVFLAFWFLSQFFSGTLALASQADGEGIAWWAHVGGFLSGIVLLAVFTPKSKRRRRADE